MFDARPGERDPIDFDEFADHLVEQGLQVSPSEVHGCICGLLAGGGPAEAEWGLAQLCTALDLDMHGDLAAQTMRLYQVSAVALEDEEFNFHPLLPDDDTGITERTATLAAWCGGFLAGFAGAGGHADSALGGDSAEVLKDFSQIAEVDADAVEPEEESEESYMELVEYLRFAALNVYLDSRAGNEGAAEPADDGAVH